MDYYQDRFHRAARDNYIDLLREATKKDSNRRDEDGMTPTIWAACYGNLEALRILVGRGGDPDIADLTGNTALHWAVNHGHVDVVSYLANYGVNLWSLNNDHQTAKDIAAIKSTYCNNGSNSNSNSNSNNNSSNNRKMIDILDFLDNVMARQSALNPKYVKKLKERAIINAEKRIKEFEKLQRKAWEKIEKEEREMEKKRRKLMLLNETNVSKDHVHHHRHHQYPLNRNHDHHHLHRDRDRMVFNGFFNTRVFHSHHRNTRHNNDEKDDHHHHHDMNDGVDQRLRQVNEKGLTPPTLTGKKKNETTTTTIDAASSSIVSSLNSPSTSSSSGVTSSPSIRTSSRTSMSSESRYGSISLRPMVHLFRPRLRSYNLPHDDDQPLKFSDLVNSDHSGSVRSTRSRISSISGVSRKILNRKLSSLQISKSLFNLSSIKDDDGDDDNDDDGVDDCQDGRLSSISNVFSPIEMEETDKANHRRKPKRKNLLRKSRSKQSLSTCRSEFTIREMIDPDCGYDSKSSVRSLSGLRRDSQVLFRQKDSLFTRPMSSYCAVVDDGIYQSMRGSLSFRPSPWIEMFHHRDQHQHHLRNNTD